MIVVKIRCGAKGCSGILATLTDEPIRGQYLPPADHPAWSDPDDRLWIEACRRHGGIPTMQTIQQADARRAERGLPPIERSRLFHRIPYSDLRASRDESAHTGRVAYVSVMPLGRL